MVTNLITIDLDKRQTLAEILELIKHEITDKESNQHVLYFTSTNTKFNKQLYNTYSNVAMFLSSSSLNEKITSLVFRGALAAHIIPLVFLPGKDIFFTDSTSIHFEKISNIIWLFEYFKLNLKEEYDKVVEVFKYSNSETLLVMRRESLNALGFNIQKY